MRYFIETYGCQMNVADSELVAGLLEESGHRRAARMDDAQIILFNTCAIREKAEKTIHNRLGQLARLKANDPSILIGVLGCMAKHLSDGLLESKPYVDMVLGPDSYRRLPQLIQDRKTEPEHIVDTRLSRFEVYDDLFPSRGEGVNAWISIMRGCDKFCTFCVVPFTRGRERSRSVAGIVAEAGKAVRQGFIEITLLGQNVDAYGHDLPDRPDLADLLRAVHEVDHLSRIRFLTSHPNDMSERIIGAVAELDKVCEHIELPVQAGHDLTLKRMARGYTVDQYRRLIERIRHRVPDVALATDVIVGFPGETEEHFQATYDLLAELQFDVVHVAAYSPRPGTAAMRLEDDVPAQEKDQRRRLIEELQHRIATAINHELLKSTAEILVDGKRKGRWRGRTHTNKLVFFEDERDWRGNLAHVEITWAGPWSMQGKLKVSDPL